VFTINAKHHRTRRVAIEGDRVSVGGRGTDYVAKAVAEADRAGRFLADAVAAAGHAGLSGRVRVRPVLAIVGARLLGSGRPGGVIVATPARLPLLLREMPEQLTDPEVEALYEVVRRSTTWTRR
jgi:hypothetical protein